MPLPHKAGVEMEVNYAEMTLPIINPTRRKISQAQVFVAYCQRAATSMEIQPSQELVHWLGRHVRGFEFFGGVSKILRTANLKSGVKAPNCYEPELTPQLSGTGQTLSDRSSSYTQLSSTRQNDSWEQHAEPGTLVLTPLRKRSIFNLGEANHEIAPLLAVLNQKEMQHLGKSRLELYKELDQPALRHLPKQDFRFCPLMCTNPREFSKRLARISGLFLSKRKSC